MKTVPVILLAVLLVLLLVVPGRAHENTQGSTVTLTFQLTIFGQVPPPNPVCPDRAVFCRESFQVYVRDLRQPRPSPSVYFCGYRPDALPACEGNGTVYTQRITVAPGSTIAYRFVRFSGPYIVQGGDVDPPPTEVLREGEITVTNDTTLSTSYTYDAPTTPPAPLPGTGVSESMRGWFLLVPVLVAGGIVLRLSERRRNG
jgi:hypothetical protein